MLRAVRHAGQIRSLWQLCIWPAQQRLACLMGCPSTTSTTKEATQDFFKWLLLASCLGGTMPATMFSARWVSIHAQQNCCRLPSFARYVVEYYQLAYCSCFLHSSCMYAVLPDCNTETALLPVHQGMPYPKKCYDSPAKLCTMICVSFLAAGNLILDPHAALLFIDFTTGDTLHLSGRAEVRWDQVDLPGAQRTIIFQTEEWVHVKGALPIKQQGPVESSPYNPTPPSKPGNLQVWTCGEFCQAALTSTAW